MTDGKRKIVGWVLLLPASGLLLLLLLRLAGNTPYPYVRAIPVLILGVWFSALYGLQAVLGFRRKLVMAARAVAVMAVTVVLGVLVGTFQPPFLYVPAAMIMNGGKVMRNVGNATLDVNNLRGCPSAHIEYSTYGTTLRTYDGNELDVLFIVANGKLPSQLDLFEELIVFEDNVLFSMHVACLKLPFGLLATEKRLAGGVDFVKAEVGYVQAPLKLPEGREFRVTDIDEGTNVVCFLRVQR